jgi:hypothetical protein
MCHPRISLGKFAIFQRSFNIAWCGRKLEITFWWDSWLIDDKEESKFSSFFSFSVSGLGSVYEFSTWFEWFKLLQGHLELEVSANKSNSHTNFILGWCNSLQIFAFSKVAQTMYNVISSLYNLVR